MCKMCLEMRIVMDYSDIIGKSRPESYRHAHMSNYERAAQFSPFAALTGYDDAIVETARLTDSKIELDEDTINTLNDRINSKSKDSTDSMCKVTITYFIKDELKEGGHYVEYTGFVRTIDDYDRIVIMSDGKSIHIDDISNIIFDNEPMHENTYRNED